MKEFDFGNGIKFRLEAEFDGRRELDYEVRINIEDFENIMKTILSKDDISAVLYHYRFNTARSYADDILNGYFCIDPDLDTLPDYKEILEDMKEFLEIDGKQGDTFREAYVRGQQIVYSHEEKLYKEIKREESKKRKPMRGFIYLIRLENGLYKIGKTKNMKSRMNAFSVTFPMAWELIYKFETEDYSNAEISLHKMFYDKRKVGEWFELTNEDVEYITSIEDFSL